MLAKYSTAQSEGQATNRRIFQNQGSPKMLNREKITTTFIIITIFSTTTWNRERYKTHE